MTRPRRATRRVLVIGAGVAGASAAIAAARAGAEVLVVAGAGGDAATAHAQGGIAAAIGAGDSPAAHAADTARAAAGLGDTDAIDVLTREGADAVRALIADGLAVDRDADGRIALGLEAAHDRARIVHAGGDRSGAVLAEHLLAAMRSSRIEVLAPARMVELVTRDGAVTGAIVAVDADHGGLRAIDADAVVLATGGYGRCYPTTSTPPGARGDGLLAAWDAGAQLADLEFVQFHPTTLPTAGGFLVSEAVRGHGAVIVDDRGRRFLLDDDPRGELAPRDVVAAGIARRIAAQDGRPVLLDATPIARRDGADALRRRFPTIDAVMTAHGLDWTREPVPVAPAAHYTMGGIRTDLHGRSSTPGLLAAGECARSGVHGANRLASNSLLEGLVFGARAGRTAAAGALDAPRWVAASIDEVIDAAGADGLATVGVPDAASTRAIIGAGIGIERDEPGLRRAVEALGAVAADPRAGAEAVGIARLGRLVGEAALRREESRGAHRRCDRPATDPRLATPLGLRRGSRAATASAADAAGHHAGHPTAHRAGHPTRLEDSCSLAV